MRKLPGTPGLPDPPPVLSADERWGGKKRGRDQTGRKEEQRGEDRRQGRGGELGQCRRKCGRRAQRDVAASRHSDYHLAIIRQERETVR